MTIPNKEECYSLQKEYRLPANVIKHIEIVTKIALFLAKKLIEKGETINLELVQAGALLHDIVRHKDFSDYSKRLGLTEKDISKQKELKEKYKGLEHGEAGYLELKEKYPEVAFIIRKHYGKHLIETDSNKKTTTWEEKLVLYADCRVTHDKIVTARERRDELYKRQAAFFKNLKDQIPKIEKAIFDLEKEIFNKIGLDSNKLGEYVE